MESSVSFKKSKVILSKDDFRLLVLNQSYDLAVSYSSSLQAQQNGFVDRETSKLASTMLVQEQYDQLKHFLDDLQMKYPQNKDVAEFRSTLLKLLDAFLVTSNTGEDLVRGFQNINSFKNKFLGKSSPDETNSSFNVVGLKDTIEVTCKGFLANSNYNVRLLERLHRNQEVEEFLSSVMSLIKLLRESKRSPTTSELVAINTAYHLLDEGHTIPPLMVSLGQPGNRPKVQTYIAVTDPGPDNIKITVQDPTILSNGITVHTEYIDRRESKDKTIVEAYRLPSHLMAARVRLAVGDDAPTSAYIGRPMFEGLPNDCSFPANANGDSFAEWARRYRCANNIDIDGNALFNAGLIKACHTVASACTSMFINGISECKIAIENMTEYQAVQFMKGVTANVMRHAGQQYLSAAFNIFMPIYSESQKKLLKTPEEIAYMGIQIAKEGGFDKVTWDGSSNVVPSVPVTVTLKHELLLPLVHKAHSVGLITYISAGMTKENLGDAVYTGVDGIGIGNDLHYLSNGKVGALDAKKMRELLEERNRVSNTTLGKAAALLARLDWLYYEGVLSDKHLPLRESLYKALLEKNEAVLQKLIVSPQLNAYKSGGDRVDKYLAHAKRLVDADSPVLGRFLHKDWREKLRHLLLAKDTVGIANYLQSPIKKLQEHHQSSEVSKTKEDDDNSYGTYAQIPTFQARKSLKKIGVKNYCHENNVKDLHGVVFEDCNLADFTKPELESLDLRDSYFIGETEFPPGLSEEDLIARGAIIIKPKKDLPFEVARRDMYSVEELQKDDLAIYNWGKQPNHTKYDRIMSVLHDGTIMEALMEFLKDKNVVGIMGGHAMKRADPVFTLIAKLCYQLSQKGFVVVTGGGPGAMEAANLGSFFADIGEKELDDAIDMLQVGNDKFEHEYENYMVADDVLKKYGKEGVGKLSLGIPTWLYGHEPFNRFAYRQAKFMSNAVREDILVNICNCGIIFSPGSAGTRTEVFQYAVPNAYSAETETDYSKPMIFLTNFWLENTLYTTCLNIAQREDLQKNRANGYSNRIYLISEEKEDPGKTIDQVVHIVSRFRESHSPKSSTSTSSDKPKKPSINQDEENGKKFAAYKAVDDWIKRDGMIVGIGSGTTVKYAAERLSQLIEKNKWNRIICVPTSFQSRNVMAQFPNLVVHDLLTHMEVDVDIDGADESDVHLNLIKGGGGALLQEKILAYRAKHFVVIAQWTKNSTTLGTNFKYVPIEVLPLAHKRVTQVLKEKFSSNAVLRMTSNGETPFVTDNGNFILDVPLQSTLENSRAIASYARNVAGVVEIGLFNDLVSAAYFGYADGTVAIRTRVPTPDRVKYLTEHARQTQCLKLVLEKVRTAAQNGQNPVVELDLDLTTMLPFSRTIAGLQAAGRDYGIREFLDPQTYFPHILPGYTGEAWDSFLQEIPQIVDKYPGLPWKSAKDPFAKPGTPGASVHSSFHIRFWERAEELATDVPSPGLLDFERRVIELGGKLVFISGRWKPEQIEYTKVALRNAKLRQPENLVIGNPHHDDSGSAFLSDSQIKQMHQETVKQQYGNPVAFFDDRVSNLDAVNEVNPLVTVVATIPGYSSAPSYKERPHVVTSFEIFEDGADQEIELSLKNLSLAPESLAASRITEAEPVLHIERIPIPEGKVRIGTFNVENLFTRFEFKKFPTNPNKELTVDDFSFSIKNEFEKKLTSYAVEELNADVLALEEVESLKVLDLFADTFLQDMGYEYRMLIQGNDNRGINVGLLSRYPIIHTRSYRNIKRDIPEKTPLFSRDCLEAVIDVKGKKVTLYINHFKSMVGGREKTHDLRASQVAEVIRILEENHGRGLKENIIVLGDFNDYVESPDDDQSAIASLVYHPQLENVVERLDKEERWTHYFDAQNEYKQLDFILMCKQLSQTNANKDTKPIIVRKGQPRRASRYGGDRYPGIGVRRPKSSDHCPVAFDVTLN